MIAANLMPRARWIAARRADRVRSWTVGLCVLGVFLAAAWLAAGRLATAAAADVGRMVDDAREQAEAGGQAVKKLRAEVTALSARVNAARAIAEHPDWSILLGLVAGLRGDDLVLETVDLAPSSPPAKAAPGRPSAYTLRLAGAARTHQSVTQFVLRLESTGLFEKVSLGDTRAADRDGVSLVAFQLQCTLLEGGRGTP